MKEKCVLCGEETPVDVTMPVDRRGKYYIDGVGQLCAGCYSSTYDEQKEQDLRKELMRLINKQRKTEAEIKEVVYTIYKEEKGLPKGATPENIAYKRLMRELGFVA